MRISRVDWDGPEVDIRITTSLQGAVSEEIQIQAVMEVLRAVGPEIVGRALGRLDAESPHFSGVAREVAIG